MEDKSLEEDKELYTIALMRYADEYPDIDIMESFPIDWNSCIDYNLKVRIIAEAIQKHIKVHETELYKNEFIKYWFNVKIWQTEKNEYYIYMGCKVTM